jgi:AraC-like DNA-binding protein
MTWIVVLLSAGALLALFLASVFLFTTAGNRRANRWLGSFLLCFALVTLSDVLDRSVQLHGRGELLHLLDWMVLLLGPLLYFYIAELTGQPVVPRGAPWLNAVPAVLVFLLFFPYHVLPAQEKVAVVLQENSARGTTRLSLLALGFAAHIALYIGLGFRSLARHSQGLRDAYSSLEARNLRWLRIVLILNGAVYAVWIGAMVFPGEWPGIVDDLAFPLTVFLLGFLALRHRDQMPLPPPAGAEPGIPRGVAAGTAPEPARYARSGLTPDRAAGLRRRLEEYMDAEKPYLDSELSLRDLADRVGASPHHLSQILNEDFAMSFYDYVNSQRVREVQRLMLDPRHRDSTILSLALAAGFNSKAAFNAAFKKTTGQTPREYRRGAGMAGLGAEGKG